MIYPKCRQCQQPQFPGKLIGHQAYCSEAPANKAGRPRIYPKGYTAKQYPRPSDLNRGKHGGPRKGLAWEWVKVGETIKAIKAGRLETGGEKDQKQVKEEVMYSVMFIRAVYQINRRTMWGWCKRHQISPSYKLHPDGTHSRTKYFTATDLATILQHHNRYI